MPYCVDIFWLNDKGQSILIISEIATNTYQPVFYKNAPAIYVLETVADFTAFHEIATVPPLHLQNWSTVLE
jgi:hypothetical protein